MYDENTGGLFSNLPASIQIEEMILGRLTFRQFIFILVGVYITYQTFMIFKMSVISFTVAIVTAVAVYMLGFFKIWKYDRHVTEHLYYSFLYKTKPQVYMPK